MTIPGLEKILTGGTGAAIPIVIMYSMFTPSDTFYRHVAESRTGTILELVDRARDATGDYKATLCRTLEEEIARLCQDSPQHPVCQDRQMYLEQAGCQ